MSTTIDQRVVEMRFDNKQFESATAQSMSTIDRLKQKLNFKDAGKGLEGVSAAVKKVDMNSLAEGVESVQVKFSSLQVIATTALANITNAAINAGKNLVSSFTIDPIVSGFREYETQMNAVQTILTNTRTKGTTLDQVNEALAELNTYADQTIYNFTQMTENIGRFTAAGVDLDTSVNSIKGLANLAAASGSSANQAAMAMYQLSQALASGTIRLQDWISVENAGMGGELFQNALKRTAEHFGTDVDAMIAKYGTFRASLTEGGWLTVDVMTETLKQLSGVYTEAELISQGYTEEQAKEIVELANSAMDAATKVKTFTQLIDTMKEAVGSGWAQTWQLIIGDFEEAKELWTGISDFFTGENGIITKMSNARNTILEGALYGNPFSDLAKRIDSVTTSTDKMTESTKDYSSVVDKVIKGDFGNGAERVNALTKANYDYAHVQNLVNEKLGSSVRHATDYKEAQEGVSKSTKTTAEDLVKLSDAQLVMMGFTQQEVEALRELEQQSERTGIPLNKLIENVDQLNGRTLLINSFKNAAKGLVQVFTSISDGWRKAFWGDASEDDIIAQKTERLYNLIAALHKFSQNLVMSDETVDKLTRTFEGLFAILDLVSTILGGGLKLGFEVLSKLLGAFDMDILDLTAMLGDAAVALRDFILDNEFVNKGFELLADGIVAAAKAIKGWIDTFLEIPAVQAAIEKVKNTLSNLKDVGLDAIEGLKNGLQNGITSIPGILVEIGRRLLDAIKGVLGIHSPSTEMQDIGEFTIEGFIEGVKSGAKTLYDTVSEVFSKVIDVVKDIFSGITFGDILAAAISVGLVVFANRILNILDSVVAPLEGLGDVLSGVGEVISEAAKPIAKTIKSFSKILSGFALQLKAKALKDAATAIAILAASLAGLAFVPADGLYRAVGAIAALGLVLGGLMAILNMGSNGAGDWKGSAGKGAGFAGMALAFVGIGGALLMMANSIKTLDGLNPDKMAQTIGSFVLLVGALMALTLIMSKLSQSAYGLDAAGLGLMMLEMSASLMIMAKVIELLGSMDQEAVFQGSAAVIALMGVMTLLGAVGGLAGKNASSLGSAMLKLSISLYLMIGVIKLLSMMDPADIVVGTLAITGFMGFITLYSLAARLAGKNAGKLGTSLIAMSVSLYLLVGVVAILSNMDPAAMQKGMTALTGFIGIIGLMLLISKLAGKEAPKIAGTILSMSLAVGALAGVAVLLSLIDVEGLKRGITAVGILSLFMTAMIAATKNTQSVTGNLVAMTVAIGLMAAAVAGLSFIDPSRLAGATAAMSILMGMFALVELAGSKIKGSMGSLIVMTTAVGLLGGLLITMSLLPLENTLENATALGLVMASLSASMLMISKVGKVNVANVAIVAGLAAVLGIISASILGVLAYMEVEPSIETATALSILLLGLSAVTIALGVAGKAASGAASGAIALVKVVAILGVLLAALGAINSIPGVQEFVDKGIPLLNSIASGLGQAIGNLISGLGVGLTDGLPAIADNLTSFMEKMSSGFAESAKAFDGEVLEGVGVLAGAIIALTAAEFINGIASLFGLGDFSSLGEQLTSLGTAMRDFSDTLGPNFNTGAVEAAAAAGQMLAELNSSLPRSGGALQDFLGTTDFDQFSEDIVSFGDAIVEFSQTVDGQVSESAVTAAVNAGTMLAELNSSLPRSGGALQEFLGEQDFATWSDKIVDFGNAIVEFSQTVDGKVSEEAVSAAANAGQMLADLNDALPPSDGALQDFLGEKDFSKWSQQIVDFGNAIVDFSDTVTGKISEEGVTAAVNAGDMLTALNEAIPESGGFMQAFFGEKSFATFGEELKHFGLGMVVFSNYSQMMNFETMDKAIAAGKSLADLSTYLSENDDSSLFFKDNAMSDFGDNIADLGEGLGDFGEALAGVDSIALGNAVTSVQRLVGVARSLDGLDTSGMTGFGKALKSMAKADIDGFISTYTDAVPKVQAAAESLVNAAVTGVQSKADQLIQTFNRTLDTIVTELQNEVGTFDTIGRTYMDNLVSGVGSKEHEVISLFTRILKSVLDLLERAERNFYTEGQEFTTQLASGAGSKTSTISTTFRTVLTEVVNSIRNHYQNFYNAGGYLVQGFANGINQNTYLAAAQARAMATAAETAAKNALGIHSPSTVFYMVGENVIKGFVQGVKENVGKVESTGEDVAESVVGGAEDALDVKNGYSELAKEVIGESFVNGIAEGITEDMSAEEAAAKKAENIVEAFENAMEKIDFSSDTLDLEQQLWDAINENLATDAQKDSATLQTLLKQYEYQNQRLELAKAEYQTMIDQFGEQSQQAKESYNRMLQQQINLADLSNQIIDIKDAEVERELDILDQQDELLQHEYQIWKNKNTSALTEAKEAIVDLALLSERYAIQLQKVNAAQSKYQAIMAMFGSNANETYEAYNEYLSQYEELSDISKQMTESRNTLREENWEYSDIGAEVDKMKDWIHRSTEAFSSSIGSSYQQSIHEALDGLTPAFSEQGTTYAEALAEGLKTGIEQLSAVSNAAIGQATTSAAKQENVFANIGEQIGSGLIFGIQSGMADMSWLESEETYGVLVSFVDGLNTLLGDTYGETFIGVGSFIFSFIDEGITVSFQTFIKTKIPDFMHSIDNALRTYGYLAYQAGVYVGTEFMNGLSSMAIPILEKAKEIGHSAGSALSAGLSSAIAAGREQINEAAKELISYAQNATMGALDAHSPSRVFMEIGSYIPLGLAKGIKDNANVVSDPISSMAVTAIENTKNTISKIAEAVNGDMNIQPTIRPVLDLSNVENGTKKLNAMFSRNRAFSIDRDMTARSTISNSVSDPTDSTVSDAGTTFNFTQNNYSPKALSRVEIYRQTNNQFSAFKRAVRV